EENNYGFEKIAVFLSWCLVVVFFPLSLLFCLIVALEFHRFVILRLGRVRNHAYGPGLVFILPCIDVVRGVDIRTDVARVDPMDMLTKDSVSIVVNAVVYYCVTDPVAAIIRVEKYRDATLLMCQVVLRNVVGAQPLHVLLSSRQALSLEIQKIVNEVTAMWGVRVERVDLMDIKLPLTLERSLATEAEAVRQAQAKIILAEGEAKASTALKEASEVMAQNQITLQLRHLQLLPALASEQRVNVVFPIPLEMMEPFLESDQYAKRGNIKNTVEETNYFVPKILFGNVLNIDSQMSLGASGMTETFWQSFLRPSRSTEPTRTRHPRRVEEDSTPWFVHDTAHSANTTRRAPRIYHDPLLPPIPPHPNMPPLPPHPNLPPLPPHPNLPPLPSRPNLP
ncbi:hypothetical protein KR018_011263, partial [Drosophila ironensis]